MQYRFFFQLGFFLIISLIAQAQELRFNVVINSQRVQTQEKQIFDDLQNAISQFLNSTKWTKDNFQKSEQIVCNLLLTLDQSTSVQDFAFKGTVQIQATRPVYGIDYQSPILNIADEWVFGYSPSQPLIFNENSYTNELSALLSFYAYLILSYDYDSFSKLGGTPYLERAFAIVNNAQSAASGWGEGDNRRSRYWQVENLMSPQFGTFRESIYTYHRLALDEFGKDPEEARKKMLGIFEEYKKMFNLRPDAAIIASFFDAKAQEIINIFSEGDLATRQKAAQILSQLDPTNAAKYSKFAR